MYLRLKYQPFVQIFGLKTDDLRFGQRLDNRWGLVLVWVLSRSRLDLVKLATLMASLGLAKVSDQRPGWSRQGQELDKNNICSLNKSSLHLHQLEKFMFYIDKSYQHCCYL